MSVSRLMTEVEMKRRQLSACVLGLEDLRALESKLHAAGIDSEDLELGYLKFAVAEHRGRLRRELIALGEVLDPKAQEPQSL